jgi:ribonuclease E
MQQTNGGAEITRETAHESLGEMPLVVTAALSTHEAGALSESKTIHASVPASGLATIQPGDPAMEAPMRTPMEAADEESSTAASSGAVAGAVAGQENRPNRLYPIQEPLSAPSAPTLLLTDASGSIRETEGVATENEGSGKTPGVTTPPALEASGKPAHALEPLNLVASGLIMIETIPGKQMAPEEQGAEESIPEGRRKRKPAPPRVTLPDEPLVQIETHSDRLT